MPDPPEPSEPSGLRCLLGAEPPAGLGADLTKLLDLPDKARDAFWVVLRCYLRPQLDDEAQRQIVTYCDEHELTTDDLAPIIKATRFLFQACARNDIEPEVVSADMHALIPDEDEARELVALLLPWLEDLLPMLRRQIAEQSIADHGKVVLESHWRLDSIARSDRGQRIGTPVALVTFRYREGDRTDRITLHLLPEQLDELRQAAAELLG
ncbi:MAG: COMM domain-containing protein [Polyangiaceae bacterium]